MNNIIQINQLLMEREDRLVEVFDLERQINAVLGQPFPLTPPDGLPSRQKRKKPKRKAASQKAATVRLRKLDEDTEDAYRIIYLDGETEKTEIHTDPKPLATLANTALPNITVQRIETVKASPPGEWDSVEILHAP
ncbi:hypothetical protein [Pontiella sulfatireligans]|uniref:Uncharacterized protein n=1 Tax=Pontiella sulfatireligans TaxID=2750658 RepID=A0A6C2UM24_9BACT|nr:hypothetical protein [Pontiella sulfatireligans]VGO21312.1 hypothetical protein SCARR_03384 [Pontiella sulfatireligans]